MCEEGAGVFGRFGLVPACRRGAGVLIKQKRPRRLGWDDKTGLRACSLPWDSIRPE
jgi:hypothetical protein